MFEKNKLLRALLAAGLTTGLVACGGGSSGGGDNTGGNDGGTGGGEEQITSDAESPTTGTEMRGQFVDSPVAGLEYRRTSEGAKLFLTDENGYYNYLDGETVTFGIGQYTIGSVTGKSVITPRDLGSDNAALNVARLLQTLDDDQDPTNGITISAEVRSKASAAATPRDITEVLNLETIASEILGIATNGADQLVSEQDASAHLEETISSISGSEVTSCSDDGAEQLTASDFNNLTLGMIASDEVLLFNFKDNGTFTEYNTGDTPSEGAVTWEGEWSFVETGQTLSLVFVNELGQTEGDAFKVCGAGNRIIAEPEDGTSFLYKLNSTIDGTRAAGSYMLRFPDHTGAVMELRANGDLGYFQGDDIFTATQVLNYNAGMTAIAWQGEHKDELYFLAGQPTRTAIYLDFDEESGEFSRIGVAQSTAPIINPEPTTEDLIGQTLLFHSPEENDVVVLEFKDSGVFTEIYNDSYDANGVRKAAEKIEGTWSLEGGLLKITEPNGEWEQFRIALSKTGMYTAAESESVIDYDGNEYTSYDDVNEIDVVARGKALTTTGFIGNYAISIPTENANETLIISEGGSCDYSGTGCNWTIDENGKGVITFGNGSDATGHVWQMANRANGYVFVMTHSNNSSDLEPGYMTRN